MIRPRYRSCGNVGAVRNYGDSAKHDRAGEFRAPSPGRQKSNPAQRRGSIAFARTRGRRRRNGRSRRWRVRKLHERRRPERRRASFDATRHDDHRTSHFDDLRAYRRKRERESESRVGSIGRPEGSWVFRSGSCQLAPRDRGIVEAAVVAQAGVVRRRRRGARPSGPICDPCVDQRVCRKQSVRRRIGLRRRRDGADRNTVDGVARRDGAAHRNDAKLGIAETAEAGSPSRSTAQRRAAAARPPNIIIENAGRVEREPRDDRISTRRR